MEQNGRQNVYYVYAVARLRDGRTPSSLPIEGIVPEALIHSLAERDLLAVFSPVPPADFGLAVLNAHLEDTDWARARVLAHQRVLAAVLDTYTLLPLKFCTICRSESDVREMLVQHHDAFDGALRRVQGSTEWGVKVYCDLTALTEWVETSDESLRPLRASIARASPGAGFFQRKKLSQAAGQITERMVEACVEESHRRLAESARDAVTNSIQRREQHGGEDEMVLNAAYLVAEERQAGFREVLADMSEKHTMQGFRYQLTGPWPPYNFATLDLGEGR